MLSKSSSIRIVASFDFDIMWSVWLCSVDFNTSISFVSFFRNSFLNSSKDTKEFILSMQNDLFFFKQSEQIKRCEVSGPTFINWIFLLC